MLEEINNATEQVKTNTSKPYILGIIIGLISLFVLLLIFSLLIKKINSRNKEIKDNLSNFKSEIKDELIRTSHIISNSNVINAFNYFYKPNNYKFSTESMLLTGKALYLVQPVDIDYGEVNGDALNYEWENITDKKTVIVPNQVTLINKSCNNLNMILPNGVPIIMILVFRNKIILNIDNLVDYISLVNLENLADNIINIDKELETEIDFETKNKIVENINKYRLK
ncbi:hypothetical protein FJO69_02235 [[Mycoplasma] falconis]|uniref:NERD domain-containing protein n=1 Tax=[Mycoplasma] falconis TaxID=92403 RepID=A0A501X9L0_9BACT|nr:hypothetical protein [[Mycoplasma] falconis]TPE57210.1 hypothetical protein FJO69_02235 [[Mycoplasma] falconis]